MLWEHEAESSSLSNPTMVGNADLYSRSTWSGYQDLSKCGRSSIGRALGCGPSGCGFKSHRSPQGSVCKWLKQAVCKTVLSEFVGSNPTASTIILGYVPEWTNGLVLKTSVVKATVCSNHTVSAK